MVPKLDKINLNVNLGETLELQLIISNVNDVENGIEYRVGDPHPIYHRLLTPSIVERLNHPKVVWIYIRD